MLTGLMIKKIEQGVAFSVSRDLICQTLLADNRWKTPGCTKHACCISERLPLVLVICMLKTIINNVHWLS